MEEVRMRGVCAATAAAGGGVQASGRGIAIRFFAFD
jgi:hypothetical protein